MRRRDSIDYLAHAVIIAAGVMIVAQGLRFLIG